MLYPEENRFSHSQISSGDSVSLCRVKALWALKIIFLKSFTSSVDKFVILKME